VFEKASTAELEPQRYDNTLAFMLESRYVIAPTRFALDSPLRQDDYNDCYQDLKKYFNHPVTQES
jgi:homogentisate 1,2-dioxygenase